VVDAVAEQTETIALVDTGASYVVISSDLLDRLGPSGRPELCCREVATLFGDQRVHMTRLSRLGVGEAEVTNLPVFVWDESGSAEAKGLFDMLSDEVGRPVEVLIGGSFLRHFVVHMDYAERIMKLSPNIQGQPPPRGPPDELVAPGFTICKHTATGDDDRSGMVIIDVFEGTDAERKGIEAGSLLVGVDGQRVDQMEAAEVRELFRSLGAGTSVRLVLAGSPQDIPLDVTIENLLPEIR
jgi:hypothetical protein